MRAVGGHSMAAARIGASARALPSAAALAVAFAVAFAVALADPHALAVAPAGAAGAAPPARAPQNRTAEQAPRASAPAPAATTATAEKDGVRAELSLTAPRGWQTGAPIAAQVAVTLPVGARLEPPALGETLGAWDVRDVRVEPGATPTSQALRMTLTAWDAGAQPVPAIPVRAELADGQRVELTVGPLEVTLVSLLADDTPLTELAAPIRGPIDIRTIRWLWIAAAVLGAALTLWMASWLFRRSREPEVPPALPPDAWAMREFDRLEGERLPSRGEFGVFFARLSDIVRHYVEQRWGLSAPEQTTKEFLRDARAHPELSGGHERTLAQFLRTADMVKFAAARPADAECTRAMDMMRGFVRASAPPAPTASTAATTPATPLAPPPPVPPSPVPTTTAPTSPASTSPASTSPAAAPPAPSPPAPRDLPSSEASS